MSANFFTCPKNHASINAELQVSQNRHNIKLFLDKTSRPMVLHVACFYHLSSQIHNIKLVFALGFTKPSEFLKKGDLPVGRNIVFQICAFETNYNYF